MTVIIVLKNVRQSICLASLKNVPFIEQNVQYSNPQQEENKWPHQLPETTILKHYRYFCLQTKIKAMKRQNCKLAHSEIKYVLSDTGILGKYAVIYTANM